MGCKPRVEHLGKKYNRLTIVEVLPHIPHANRKCVVECECGISKELELPAVVYGRIKSCGCIRKGLVVKHGLSKKRIYKTYTTMMRRCYNPECEKFKTYGAKGITVCDEWKEDPIAFYNWAISNGYSDDLTIDRIKVQGNYEPSNCRWATQKQQANNRTTNIFLTLNGVTLTVTEWADILCVDSRMLFLRLKRGWSTEKTLTTPKIIR